MREYGEKYNRNVCASTAVSLIYARVEINILLLLLLYTRTTSGMNHVRLIYFFFIEFKNYENCYDTQFTIHLSNHRDQHRINRCLLLRAIDRLCRPMVVSHRFLVLQHHVPVRFGHVRTKCHARIR